MFTGLIREIGRLRGASPRGGVVRLDIVAPATASDAAVGDSIAVDGICLTVTRVRGDVFSVEAATETRRVTTMAGWRAGRRLHLEPALRIGDPLDGHLVQGHVDGIGRVRGVRRRGRDLLLTVHCGRRLAGLLAPKGSIAVDGVSLTVDEGPHRDRFTVNLVPQTLDWTTFGHVRPGRIVNLEMDLLVKAARSGSLADLPAVDAVPRAAPAADRPPLRERLLRHGFARLRPKGRP